MSTDIDENGFFGMGHNSAGMEKGTCGELKAIIERVENLEEEKKEVAEQIREVFSEAKGNGYDTKTIRKILAIRKKSDDERAQEEALLDLYLRALGMQGLAEI